MLVIVESFQKLLLHLSPATNGFWLYVGIPVKSCTFQHSDKLFYHKVAVRASIVACFDEMCHMLFWVALPVKLLEFWRLIAPGHVERVTPLGVRLGFDVSLARASAQLHLDCICNQVLNLLDGHQAWRPPILEFTALL